MRLEALAAALVVSVVTGCSTVPVQPPDLSGPAIVVTRDKGFTASGCRFTVLVDGKSIGQVGAGQSVSSPVSSGSHRVEIVNATAVCPNVQMSDVVEVADLPVVFRIGITSNFQVIFNRVR